MPYNGYILSVVFEIKKIMYHYYSFMESQEALLGYQVFKVHLAPQTNEKRKFNLNNTFISIVVSCLLLPSSEPLSLFLLSFYELHLEFKTFQPFQIAKMIKGRKEIPRKQAGKFQKCLYFFLILTSGHA